MATWPVESTTITSQYGTRIKPTAGATTNHKGIDISTSSGSSVLAAISGVVKYGYNGTSGNWLSITGSDGTVVTYKHLSQILDKTGHALEGQKVALSGNTGVSTGPHLHVEVMKDGTNIDPSNWFSNTAGSRFGSGEMLKELNSGLTAILNDYWYIFAVGIIAVTVIGRKN